MILALALAVEWLIGDPQSRWHPVALFGRWAGACESLLYGDARGRGVLAWGIATGLPFACLWLGHEQLGWAFDALLVWAALGWRSLFVHVRAVLDATGEHQARRAVARIVSRDTAGMDLPAARRAALESLAENASDAVVAPLFWFVLLGAPGAFAYRMVNTLDAMWGYRNARYYSFGWWAAKADDVANWLPARLTAWLMLRAGRSARWADVRLQAQTHASPNAGWPEVALAHAADVRLGGPVMRAGAVDERPYYGPGEGRTTEAGACLDALRVARDSLLMAAAAAMGLSLVL